MTGGGVKGLGRVAAICLAVAACADRGPPAQITLPSTASPAIASTRSAAPDARAAPAFGDQTLENTAPEIIGLCAAVADGFVAELPGAIITPSLKAGHVDIDLAPTGYQGLVMTVAGGADPSEAGLFDISGWGNVADQMRTSCLNDLTLALGRDFRPVIREREQALKDEATALALRIDGGGKAALQRLQAALAIKDLGARTNALMPILAEPGAAETVRLVKELKSYQEDSFRVAMMQLLVIARDDIGRFFAKLPTVLEGRPTLKKRDLSDISSILIIYRYVGLLALPEANLSQIEALERAVDGVQGGRQAAELAGTLARVGDLGKLVQGYVETVRRRSVMRVAEAGASEAALAVLALDRSPN